jgi:hypothetical protein
VEDAVGVDLAVAEDLGRDPVLGAELGERRRGREQLHVRGQRPGPAGGAGAEDLLGFGVDDEEPARRAAALVQPGAHPVAGSAGLGPAREEQEKAC